MHQRVTITAVVCHSEACSQHVQAVIKPAQSRWKPVAQRQTPHTAKHLVSRLDYRIPSIFQEACIALLSKRRYMQTTDRMTNTLTAYADSADLQDGCEHPDCCFYAGTESTGL